MQTKEIISSINHTCTVHKRVHRLSCYMNIPKYSKLFIQIVRETFCPGNVFLKKWLSGKRPLADKITNQGRQIERLCQKYDHMWRFYAHTVVTRAS